MMMKPARQVIGVLILLFGLVLSGCGGANELEAVVIDGSVAKELIKDNGDYQGMAERLLTMGDPERGLLMVQEYDCIACHLTFGDDPDILPLAPPFEQVRDLAAERRPNMSVEAYIYESIMYPQEFLVEDYFGTMPDYSIQLNEQDLADIMVFILEGDVMALYEDSE